MTSSIIKIMKICELRVQALSIRVMETIMFTRIFHLVSRVRTSGITSDISLLIE